MDLLRIMSGGFDTDKQSGGGGGTDIVYVTELKGTIEGLGTNQIVRIYRGDNRTLKVSVVDGNDAPVSLAGVTVKYSVKIRLIENQAKIDKSSGVGSEILITNPANGVYEVYLIPSDTQDLEEGVYEYDSEITTVTGKVYTVVRGKFVVLVEIT